MRFTNEIPEETQLDHVCQFADDWVLDLTLIILLRRFLTARFKCKANLKFSKFHIGSCFVPNNMFSPQIEFDQGYPRKCMQ